MTGNPALATLAAVFADALGAVPTVRQAFRAPEREMWQPYALSVVAATAGLVALEGWSVATAGFNVYLVLLCALIVALIISGARRGANAGTEPVPVG